jgi:hypothetical protein
MSSLLGSRLSQVTVFSCGLIYYLWISSVRIHLNESYRENAGIEFPVRIGKPIGIGFIDNLCVSFSPLRILGIRDRENTRGTKFDFNCRTK